MNTESTSTSNPQPTVQDPVEPMYYAVGGRRPLAKTGKSFDEEIRNKYFRKLPRKLGREIENKWSIYYASLLAKIATGELTIRGTLGIGPRIIFTFYKLREKCIEVKIQKDLKKQNYDFCSSVIYTPQQYEDKYNRKKYKKYEKYRKEKYWKKKYRKPWKNSIILQKIAQKDRDLILISR